MSSYLGDMYYDELQEALRDGDRLAGQLASAYEEIAELQRNSGQRVFALSSELRIVRTENERLLKLLQYQNRQIRVSDAAQEMALADTLATALLTQFKGRSAHQGHLAGDALDAWKARRGAEEESENTNEWGKRVS